MLHRCIDNAGLPPMRIQCALALRQSMVTPSATAANATAASSFFTKQVFDVVFQQRSTANYMTCAMAQISVQSVRWPATRFTGRYVHI